MKRKHEVKTIIFDGKHEVRSVVFDGKVDDVWFVAPDYVQALGMTWHTDRVDFLSKKWLMLDKIIMHQKNNKKVTREVWLINEQAAIILAVRSNHPKAFRLIEEIGEFIKKVKYGQQEVEDINNMRKEAQLYFDFLTPFESQWENNHKKNRTKGLEQKNSEFWNDGHQIIGGKSYQERKAELIARGAPEALVTRSGLDGLRWFEDTYHESITHSLRAWLAKEGYPIEKVNQVIEKTKDGWKAFGDLVAEKESKRFREEKRHQEEYQADAIQINLFG